MEKYAVLRHSDKPSTGLPIKKVSDVIKELEEEGYTIINNL